MNSLREDSEYQKLRRKFKDTIKNSGNSDLMRELALDMFQSCPEPCWIKYSDGRMVAVNSQYTLDFGINLDDYLGQFDTRVWDAMTAKSFDENDQRALNENRAIECIEEIELNGETIKLDVVKWPVNLTINGRRAVFVAGKCRRRNG